MQQELNILENKKYYESVSAKNKEDKQWTWNTLLVKIYI
jgi:hypothetical protein